MYKKAVALLISAALTFSSAVAPLADEIMAKQGCEEMEDVFWDLSPEEDAVEEEWEETIQVYHDVPEEGNGDHEDEDYGDIPLIEDMDPVVEDLYSVCEEETEQEESREEETESEAKAEPANQEETESATEEMTESATEEMTEAQTEEVSESAAEEMTEEETEECTEEIDEEEGIFEICLEEEAEEDLIEEASSFEDISTTIYFLDPVYQTSIQIPSSYPQEYQIDLTGIENPKIYSARAEGSYTNSSQVSEAGLVTLRPTYWHRSGSVWVSGYLEGGQNRMEYNTGTMIYRVYDGSDLKFTVTVEAADYAGVAYSDLLTQAEASIDTSRGDYQTFVNIVKYVAENYSYSASYSSARSMVLTGGGDCWASTDMIVSMGKDFGLDVRSRNANHDPGSGSGHYNALAKINGKYYIGEAGYAGTKPRDYTVYEEPEGFAFLSGRIYQYDGDDDVVTIPSAINGRTVTSIGYTNDTGGVFTRGRAKVTAVNIPATVTSIYDAAFFDASYLTRINVDPANTKYKSIDGVLYSKDGTTLIKVPNAKEQVAIPEGVTALNRLSLDCCTKLKTLELPSTLTTIGEGAFYYMSGCTITIPASVTEIGANAFAYMRNCAVQVEEGSYAASYCEENGVHTETYTVNENGIKEVSHLWDEGVQETAPGCEEEGTLVYTCSVCKEKRYEAIPALGHDYEVLERQEPDCINAGHIRHIHCKRCDRHFAKEDAATAADEQAFAIPALGHAMVVTEPAEATCTETGTKGYYTCSRCNGVFTDAEGTVRTTVAARTIKATGHDTVYHSAKGATCTEEGNQYYYECENCDRIFLDWRGQTETTLEERTIAPLGHSIGKIPGYDATCTASGRREYWKCYRCYELFADEALEHTITAEETVIPAYGHQMSKVEATEPTCTENGTLGYYSCSRCAGVFADEEGTERTSVAARTIYATGHDLTYHSAKTATCTREGHQYYYECEECDRLFLDWRGQTETTLEELTVAPLGHSVGKISGYDAACTADGRAEHWKCSRCNELFADEASEHAITAEETVIPACGHLMSKVEATEPTCTENGTLGYYTCSRCAGTFADEEGTERTTVYERTLWAPGHDMTYHSANAPTCTQAGNSSYYECRNCGHQYEDRYGTSETSIEEETLPAYGHDISLREEKDATCAEEGCLAHYECSNCGKCFSDAEGSAEIDRKNVIVPRPDHTWGDYEICREASCAEEGVSHPKCSVCGALDRTVSVSIPAAGHKWASAYTVDIAATMEKEGIKSIHCLRCGKKKAGSEVRIARTEPVTIRKKVAKVKAKTKKSKVTVSWKKLSAKVLKKNRILGIQIRVAKDRAFQDIVKDKRVGKKKKTWKFSANKGTYFVKVRYYGPNGYSKWSKVIRVKAK